MLGRRGNQLLASGIHVGALVVFDGLPLPDRALVRVLRNGALVHEQGLSGIIKSIIVRIHGLAGLRGGKAYTRRLSDTG